MRLSVLHGHLVLLQLAVWHLEGPGLQCSLCELDPVGPQCHSSAQSLIDLGELFRSPQRSEACGKVLQRLRGEITIRVIREQRAIDCSMLQPFENLASL